MKDSSSRSFRDPDALIARAGVAGDPNHDQHFLVDDRVLDRLTGYLPTDTDRSHLLEIGAGTGALTDRLLEHGKRVTAIERDPALVEFLRSEFEDAITTDRLTVIEGDALDVELPDVTASVSNLPYSASSDILFRLLPRSIPLVVMVQREFAARMAADPGTDEYGRLSVTAGHYGECEIVEPVPREAFSPSPPVESAVVRVVPHTPTYTVPDDEFFLDFVTAVFTQRRKTVRNAIRNTVHISNLRDPENVVSAIEDETLSKRPGDLSPSQFAALARSAFKHGEPKVDSRD
ncbi:16S ribosomal RNA methyltransferase A [Halocatena salina]|uniref:Probable ribosomal RNA small subunit methyltransferase A n=1 Tax=Halocatena salina TaxID=2934340 RepID=A0A8U0A235_9EURY|nr:16S ribosomal RNA methyltransferase A [Halocatena salina]UPM43132.1 16S ribosomal RNA methyltransferase A [Halocatena salina]